MLVVKIELHNANTGAVSEIGRAVIANVGGTDDLGDYRVCIGREGCRDNRDVYGVPERAGHVEKHHRLTDPVWTLVRKALESVGF